MTRVFAGVASIPERIDSLERAVGSLLPQVDRLGVFLNGYESIPDFLSSPKIVVARSQDHRDYGDAGKFFFVGQAPEYYLSCDDDLVYPDTYAETLVRAVDSYNRKAFVGFHGRLLGPGGVCFRNHRCTGEVKGDHPVNILGTGVLGFHVSRFIPYVSFFPTKNMADHYLASALWDRGVPMVVLSHTGDWIVPIKQARTIWRECKARTGSEMDVGDARDGLERERKWGLPQRGRCRVIVAITTHNRREMLNQLLADIRRERDRYDCEVVVRVYDDASEIRSDGIVQQHGLSGEYLYFENNYGRSGHWKLWNLIMSDLRGEHADWYVMLPDDVSLAPHFFSRGIELFESGHPDSLSLNCNPSRKGPCWTGRQLIDMAGMYETGWVDGLFMCKRELFDMFGWAIREPVRRDGMGSGVGSVMSREAIKQGAKLCMAKRSLVQAHVCPSQMNVDIRSPEDQASELVCSELDDDSAVYEVGSDVIVGGSWDHISRPLEKGRYYEEGLLGHIESLGLVGTYVDVGANIGNHTLFFARHCKSTKVVSVEPNQKSFRRLSETIDRNGIREKVTAIRAAAHGYWGGAVVVDGPKGNAGMARAEEGSDVPVVRIDEIAWDHSVALIKIDVEGHVLDVVESAAAIVKRDRPHIFAETDEPELIDSLLGDGYERCPEHFAYTPVWWWYPRG